jgi:hypothetical protein
LFLVFACWRDPEEFFFLKKGLEHGVVILVYTGGNKILSKGVL